MKRFFLITLLGISNASAHDTWVQLNVARASGAQPVFADLMLGNHGNNHRDFKLDSKIPLAGSTLAVIDPEGVKSDLTGALVDMGGAEKDGFWSARVAQGREGLYCVAHTYEAVVSYAPKRAIKSAKAYFSKGGTAAGFDKPLGHALEIVPLSDPTNLKAGDPLKVKILFKGEALKEVVVSCIPRGAELAADFDPEHEGKTNAEGEVTLPLPESNLFLVVTHWKAPEETGEKFSAGTEYGATLTLVVGEK